jgi:hypothetical protein
MGQQHRVTVKRKRRDAYIKRQKEAVVLRKANKGRGDAAKKAVKKAPAKKAAAKKVAAVAAAPVAAAPAAAAPAAE